MKTMKRGSMKNVERHFFFSSKLNNHAVKLLADNETKSDGGCLFLRDKKQAKSATCTVFIEVLEHSKNLSYSQVDFFLS